LFGVGQRQIRLVCFVTNWNENRMEHGGPMMFAPRGPRQRFEYAGAVPRSDGRGRSRNSSEIRLFRVASVSPGGERGGRERVGSGARRLLGECRVALVGLRRTERRANS
jgi:hypothetical protein